MTFFFSKYWAFKDERYASLRMGGNGEIMANGMGSLYIGASGLKSAQSALNTTAHNLANVNTDGYTRQQVSMSDTFYHRVSTLSNPINAHSGTGVNISEIRRIRDDYMDAAYRSENSRLGYYSSQHSAVVEVEDLFGEMQGITFQQTLINLRDSISELAKETSSTIKRSSLIQYASAFLERADAVYTGLKDYQKTLNTSVQNMVDRINELGDTIYSLNKQIQKIEATGIEKANDLRDQRDAALDELSQYIKIDYFEEKDKSVTVLAEGRPFVNLTSVNHMSTRTQDGSSLLIPTWSMFETDVFKDSESISVILDNDKGELKGLLTARGYVEVDYTDVPVKPLASDYDLTTQDGVDKYNSDMQAYQEKQEYYNKYIEPSVILSAIAGLDKLVNGIVESINDVLCPEKELTMTTPLTDAGGAELAADLYIYNNNTNAVLYTADGKAVNGQDNGDGTYRYESGMELFENSNATNAAAVDTYKYLVLDMEKTDYGMDDDKSVGTELFSRKNTERYTIITEANGDKMYVRNNLNTIGAESLYTLGNIVMNKEATANNGSKLPFTTLQGKEDLERGKELVDIWDNAFASLNPEQYSVSTFESFYNNFVGEFATVGRVLDNYVSNQTMMVEGYDDKRLQVAGVSSDEELTKLIKYQQAYNAASRYINAVSEMLEHLITSLT